MLSNVVGATSSEGVSSYNSVKRRTANELR